MKKEEQIKSLKEEIKELKRKTEYREKEITLEREYREKEIRLVKKEIYIEEQERRLNIDNKSQFWYTLYPHKISD